MDVSASSKQASATLRRDAIYRYGCQPQRGDSIRDLARSWGCDLDEYEHEDRERVFAELHREPDDDAYRGPRR